MMHTILTIITIWIVFNLLYIPVRAAISHVLNAPCDPVSHREDGSSARAVVSTRP